MIFGGEFVSGIDLVDICLWLFTIFFLGLVLYLQREGMREGYPTEEDTTGRVDKSKYFFGPLPKVFKLPHGRGELKIDHARGDTRKLALRRTAVWPGAPYAPTGDPMADGVGPASYAERSDIPDLTMEGEPRIAPFSASPGFEVADADTDPRGLPVRGADGKEAGVVVDLWVDRSEAIIRYYEVETGEADGVKRRALVPVAFAKIVGGRKPGVEVEAITAAQFAGVPATKAPASVTRLEEDRIAGYFGGGKLYATPARQEPLL